MNAFEVSYWIYQLDGRMKPKSLDDESIEAVKRLFELTSKLASVGEDDRKDLWLSAPRGSLEEYREYYYEDDDDDVSDEELRESMLSRFPDEVSWFSFVSVHHDVTGRDYYGVYVGNKYVLAINDCNADGFAIDATPFINWLIEEVEKVIAEVSEGTYNERIASSLPYKHREGTILRRDYWDVYPELREEYRSCFSESEIDTFLQTAKDFGENKDSGKCISHMTARQFYEACAIGYKALGFEPKICIGYTESDEERARYGGVTPKEYYYMYADGRDDGLKNVPMDDAEAFEEWLKDEGPYYEFNGHHPWEIIPSFSIVYSMHMYVMKTESGYYFMLCGETLIRSDDTIRFYLALKAAGVPVYLHDADTLKARLTETDLIGILPEGTYSPYTSTVGDKRVADIISLEGDEKDQLVIAKASWMDETAVTLAE